MDICLSWKQSRVQISGRFDLLHSPCFLFMPQYCTYNYVEYRYRDNNNCLYIMGRPLPWWTGNNHRSSAAHNLFKLSASCVLQLPATVELLLVSKHLAWKISCHQVHVTTCNYSRGLCLELIIKGLLVALNHPTSSEPQMIQHLQMMFKTKLCFVQLLVMPWSQLSQGAQCVSIISGGQCLHE